MDSEDETIIHQFSSLKLSPISFSMKDIANVIEQMESEIPSFETVCLDKIMHNFVCWAKKNAKHDLPKTNYAWENLISNQFSKIKICVDPKALYANLHIDFRSYNIDIQILNDRIRTFIKRPKNNKWSYDILMKKLRTFCHFENRIPATVIMDELKRRGIIINNILTIKSGEKRKINDESTESKSIFFNSTDGMKKPRF
jgi:hypothetical protein